MKTNITNLPLEEETVEEKAKKVLIWLSLSLFLLIQVKGERG